MKQVGNISSSEYRQLIWRSLHLQSVACFERQQGIAYGYALIPSLKRIYKDDPEKYAEALTRGISFFNVTPAMVTYIMGMNIAMEESAAENPEFDTSMINAVKTSLMGPLSGVGDAIFWGALRTITLGIGISFAVQGNILGPILFWVLYNIPHFYVRINGLRFGYENGMDLLSNAAQSGSLSSLTSALKIVGATVVGSMIYSIVNFSTTLTLHFDTITMNLQTDLFDRIYPAILPFALSFATFYFLRKGMKPTKVMAVICIFAILVSVLENLVIFMPAA